LEAATPISYDKAGQEATRQSRQTSLTFVSCSKARLQPWASKFGRVIALLTGERQIGYFRDLSKRQIMKRIAFVTTSKGRLHHIKVTLPHIVTQGWSDVIVVDYGCPDRTGDWVEANFPSVKVIRVNDDTNFCVARARNLGAAQTNADWLVFIDADIISYPGWTEWMQQQLQAGSFYRSSLVSGRPDYETFGTMICARSDFEAVGGYDEVYRGWGGEDRDIYERLVLRGIMEGEYPAKFVTAIHHGDEERAGWAGLQNKQEVLELNRSYREVKKFILKDINQYGDLPFAIRKQCMDGTRRQMAEWFNNGKIGNLIINYKIALYGKTYVINLTCGNNQPN
jgi:glycosyltransferase involved in cell wall biosynthesis